MKIESIKPEGVTMTLHNRELNTIAAALAARRQQLAKRIRETLAAKRMDPSEKKKRLAYLQETVDKVEALEASGMF